MLLDRLEGGVKLIVGVICLFVFACVYLVIFGVIGSLVGIIVAFFKGGKYDEYIVNGFKIGAGLGMELLIVLAHLVGGVIALGTIIGVVYFLFRLIF